MTSKDRYPIGARLREAELIADPYSAYAELRRHEPVSWIADLSMWWVVDHEAIVEILQDVERFTTASGHSLIFDTFGAQMLSTDGADHARYKAPARPAFTAGSVRRSHEAAVARLADRLIDGLGDGRAELRSEFAARLPVLTMLEVFGLPAADEPLLRRWYDAFEKALSNFTWDDTVRRRARDHLAEFHDRLQATLDATRRHPSASLIGRLVDPTAGLSDEEIRRNAAIILFGGISTVEALILNTMWTFAIHPEALAGVRADPAALPAVVEEVIRWLSPVHSATRHVTRDLAFRGHAMKAGEVVNCMLAAGNRDPRVFANPDRFQLGRPTHPRHLGFAVGPHLCLGMHLARMEAQIAIEALLRRLPGLAVDLGRSPPPRGYEFHQPPALHVAWRPETQA